MLRRSVPRFILLAALVVAGYLLFNTALTAIKSYRLAADEQETEREITEMDSRYERLVALREYLSSDEYIESVARRMLGLVKPGETLLKITSPEGEAPDAGGDQEKGDTWWESLFGQ